MKTKIFLSIVLLFSVVSFSFASSGEEDTVKPVINLMAPADGSMVRIGADVHFDMELTDDQMLASYRVEIHDNYNNHDHADGPETPQGRRVVFDRTWDISGQKTIRLHHHQIIIPATSKVGPYHFVVYCTDAAGNESSVVRDIELGYTSSGGHH